MFFLYLQFHSLIDTERLHAGKLKLSLFATLAVDLWLLLHIFQHVVPKECY